MKNKEIKVQKMDKTKGIYLDYAATTYVDERVLKVMLPYFRQIYANPSALHYLGLETHEVLDSARKSVAKVLACQPEEIIFTSGGTESINLALQGVALANREKGNHIITSKIEHPAVLETCKFLEQEGFEVTYLEVDRHGLVDVKELEKAIRKGTKGKDLKKKAMYGKDPKEEDNKGKDNKGKDNKGKDTILISIMFANNEIGTVEPIGEIGKVARKYGVLFHTDACQAGGALDLEVKRLNVDLMTLNGSKIYGPKGAGILYKKSAVKITPLIHGGGQEANLRSGTENLPCIVGFAAALKLAQQEKEAENKRLIKLRDYFIEQVLTKIPKSFLNGHPSKRLPNNVNISFLDIEGESILLYLNEKGIYVSTGSACSSKKLEVSHVLDAIGLEHDYAHGSIRFSLGKKTTKEELDFVVKELAVVVNSLRKLSPLNLKMREETK